jgi:hypothetical protein
MLHDLTRAVFRIDGIAKPNDFALTLGSEISNAASGVSGG